VNTEKNESIIIFKKFDEKKNIMKDDITAKNIIKFVDLYAYPKVIEFSKDTSYIIFTKRNPALIIFSSKTRKNYENIKKILNDIWPKVGSKIRLFICNEVDLITLIFSEYFTMEQLISSNAYIVHAENENPTKYVMSEDITEENILNFINKWDNGELEPIIKSQEVPKNNNGDVFILVGKNFKKEVLDNKKDVLVYFTSHFCRICKDFEPKLAELAKKLKHNNPNLLIAKMDAIANEVEGLQINKFPTIKFYPGNAKDKEPLGYFTRRNITGLYNFIKKNAYNKIIEDESNKITDL
jgi:protein disulfide isomerase